MNSDNTYVYINSAEELERMKQNPVYILYFSSEDCNVCHSVFPKLLELNETAKLPIGRIDVNQNLEIAGQHLVFNIPTILIFSENSEILRESRFIDFSKLERILNLLWDVED